MDFFKPSKATGIILGIFIPVAIFGSISTYGFTYDYEDRAEHPPPFLYDQVKDYPFWTIWAFSIAPLIPFTSLVQSMMSNVEGSYFVFMALNLVYYYLISCAITLVYRRINRSGIMKAKRISP